MTATTACVAAATSTGGESAEAWCGREYAVSSTDDQSSELSQQ